VGERLAENPVIIAFVRDLNFLVRIESVADLLGYRLIGVETADEFGPGAAGNPGRPPAEPLIGREALLIKRISELRPSLLIFDLGNQDIPWKDWINLLTSVPATRRIPVLCYGSHVDAATLREAKKAGATRVVARSKFSSDLSSLIGELARRIDHKALEESCLQPLSAEARRGLEEFNRGEYFEAHESLEFAWKADSSPARELYRAVLQVAVAYYQILRGNYNGAMKMFLRNHQWIDPLPDHCRGIDVAQLRKEAREVHDLVVSLGPERIGEFDKTLLRPVQYRV
jgi:predicted metal-dependent hydrolase